MSIHEETSRVAEAPFDDEQAGAILRSSDKVDFHVYPVILVLASPFFKSMFSLQQPGERDGAGPSFRPREPINVSEDSVVLDYLLRFCYPIFDPVVVNLTTLGQVLEAAMKYEMQQPTQVLRGLLKSRIASSALEVYTICCALSLATDARLAAQAYRKQHKKKLNRYRGCIRKEWNAAQFSDTTPGYVYNPSFKELSAGAYHRLLHHARTGKTTAFSPHRTSRFQRTFPDLSPFGADLKLRSLDQERFACHRAVLYLASAQQLIASGSNYASQAEGVQCIDVALDAQTLNDLLEASYPLLTTSRPLDRNLLPFPVLFAAQRFNIIPLLAAAKSHWSKYVSHDSISAYFGAITLGWAEQAQQAARGTIDRDVFEGYVREMESSSAEVYQNLLEYHYRCYQIARFTLLQWKQNTHVLFTPIPADPEFATLDSAAGGSEDYATMIENSEEFKRRLDAALAPILLK